MLDLSRLSSEQRQAVLAPDGPLLIIAGPGSGKTTLLAARIAYLVTWRQISPQSILALTFATKAARASNEAHGAIHSSVCAEAGVISGMVPKTGGERGIRTPGGV